MEPWFFAVGISDSWSSLRQNSPRIRSGPKQNRTQMNLQQEREIRQQYGNEPRSLAWRSCPSGISDRAGIRPDQRQVLRIRCRSHCICTRIWAFRRSQRGHFFECRKFILTERVHSRKGQSWQCPAPRFADVANVPCSSLPLQIKIVASPLVPSFANQPHGRFGHIEHPWLPSNGSPL